MNTYTRIQFSPRIQTHFSVACLQCLLSGFYFVFYLFFGVFSVCVSASLLKVFVSCPLAKKSELWGDTYRLLRRERKTISRKRLQKPSGSVLLSLRAVRLSVVYTSLTPSCVIRLRHYADPSSLHTSASGCQRRNASHRQGCQIGQPLATLEKVHRPIDLIC